MSRNIERNRMQPGANETVVNPIDTKQFPRKSERGAKPFKPGRLTRIILLGMGVVTSLSVIGAKDAKASQPEDVSQKPGQPAHSVESHIEGPSTPFPQPENARMGPDPLTSQNTDLNGEPLVFDVSEEDLGRVSSSSKNVDGDPEQDDTGPEPLTPNLEPVGFNAIEVESAQLPQVLINSFNDTYQRRGLTNFSIFYTLEKNHETDGFDILNETFNRQDFQTLLGDGTGPTHQAVEQLLSYMEQYGDGARFRLDFAASNWGTENALVTVLVTALETLKTDQDQELVSGSLVMLGDSGQEIVIQPNPGEGVQFSNLSPDLYNFLTYRSGFSSLENFQMTGRQMVAVLFNSETRIPTRVITGNGQTHLPTIEPTESPTDVPPSPEPPIPEAEPVPEPQETFEAGLGETPEPEGGEGAEQEPSMGPTPDLSRGLTPEALTQMTPEQREAKAAYDELVNASNFNEVYAEQLANRTIVYNESYGLYFDNSRNLFFVPMAGVERGGDDFATSHNRLGWGNEGMTYQTLDFEPGISGLRIFTIYSDSLPHINTSRYKVDTPSVRAIPADWYLSQFANSLGNGETIYHLLIPDYTRQNGFEVGGPLASYKRPDLVGGLRPIDQNTYLAVTSSNYPDEISHPGTGLTAFNAGFTALHDLLQLRFMGTMRDPLVTRLSAFEEIFLPMAEEINVVPQQDDRDTYPYFIVTKDELD